MRMIELGPGTSRHPQTFLGIDTRHPHNSAPQDATHLPWRGNRGVPVPDESVHHVFASHFIEHVPKGQATIDVMNEAWRVLQPGGHFTMIMPLIGYTRHEIGNLVAGWQPYADPTHVQGWWLPESILYFCKGPFAPQANYGISTWEYLGGEIPENEATEELKWLRRGVVDVESFWSIRGGWEGVARIQKPVN